jgi:hypothetical protein
VAGVHRGDEVAALYIKVRNQGYPRLPGDTQPVLSIQRLTARSVNMIVRWASPRDQEVCTDGSANRPLARKRFRKPGLRRVVTVWTNEEESSVIGHMSISVQDRKRLWGRAASRCAFPDCRQELIEEMTDGQGDFLVGQEAHIIARNADGPRGKSDLSTSQRDTYENLILLCARHHIIADNDVMAYPVERLLAIKSDHELWVARQLDISHKEQATLERYGQIIDEWTDRAKLDHWVQWSSHITNPLGPVVSTETMERLTNLGIWMLGIIWPQTLTSLERSFYNFQTVLRDFIVEFNMEADYVGQKTSHVSAVTQRPASVYVPSEIRRREREHADLVVDLMFELTRAANYLCSEVREHVDAQFHLREGALRIVINWSGSEEYARPEYREDELNDLYPGLDRFRVRRDSRDLHCPPLSNGG